MLFAYLCTDKPNGLDLRMKVRPEHLAYLETLGGKLKLAGPFTDDAGSSNGTLMVCEAEDRAAAEAIAAADPYAKAGLFSHVEIKPWKWLIKNPDTK